MSKATPSLNRFLINLIKPYKGLFSVMENVMMGVSLMAIGVAIFLIGARDDGIDKNNDTTSLFGCLVCWFGRNSYELYLLHIIVLALMKEMVSPDVLGNYTKLLWMALFLSASALVAGFISILYSQPINKKLRVFLSGYRQRKTFSPALSGETSSIV